MLTTSINSMTRHLVAMGGGGFSMSQFGEPTVLDNYLVGVTGMSHPRVCFAPTASGDDATYTHRFLTAYGSLGVRTSVLTLWSGAAEAVDRLSEADLLFVGGGSTVNLLALWEAHGVSQVVRQRYSEGTLVLAGISAGAACWYQGCVTDSFGDLRPWGAGWAWSAGASARTLTASRSATSSTPPRWRPENCPAATPRTTARACTTWMAFRLTSSPSGPVGRSTECCPTTFRDLR